MMKLNLQLFALKTAVSSAIKGVKKTKKNNGTNTTAQSYAKTNSSGSGSSGGSYSASYGGAVTSGTSGVSGNSSIKGVNQNTQNKMQSSYQKSSAVSNAQAEADAYRNKLKEMSNVTDIVDQSTWDAINTPFNASSAYTEAMNYTNGLLEQLSSGRTSYTDRINALMDEIQNREKFEYDVDSDTLFQQSLASAMSSGKTAMQDTIGQASALTGGYGSTYATSAGNQAYNSFIQDAYNNLPEYYQMALEAYQMEGDEMYKQLAMLGDADATEYQRTYNAWNANFNNAQQMYENEYSAWQDSVNNAFNSANLQLNEQGQLYDQAYNTYNAVQNNANTLYAQEYQRWADEVNNAFNYASIANSDYWNQKEMDYKHTALAQDNAQFYASLNAKTGSGGSGSGASDDGYKEPTETQMKKALEAYNTGGDNALYQYVDSLGSDVNMDTIDAYVSQYGQLPLEKRTFTKTKDTTNWFWGTDNNDKVKDQYGNTYRIDELPESLRKSLTKLKENESYTAK